MLPYITAFQSKTEQAFSLKRLRIQWQIWWLSDNWQTWTYENFVLNAYKTIKDQKSKVYKALQQHSAVLKAFSWLGKSKNVVAFTWLSE